MVAMGLALVSRIAPKRILRKVFITELASVGTLFRLFKSSEERLMLRTAVKVRLVLGSTTELLKVYVLEGVVLSRIIKLVTLTIEASMISSNVSSIIPELRSRVNASSSGGV